MEDWPGKSDVPRDEILPWSVTPTADGILKLLGWYEQTDAAAALASGTPVNPSTPGYSSHFVFNVSGAVGLPFTLRILGVTISEDTGDPAPAIVITGTTTSAATDKLIDTLALFQSNGVVAGMLVYNSTDDTWAEVVSVDSETQLTLDADIMASGENYRVGNHEDITVSANGYYQSSKTFIDAPLVAIVEAAKSCTAEIIRTSYWDRGNTNFTVRGIRVEWNAKAGAWTCNFRVWQVNNDGSRTAVYNKSFLSTDPLPRGATSTRCKDKSLTLDQLVLGSQEEGLVIEVDQIKILTFYGEVKLRA